MSDLHIPDAAIDAVLSIQPDYDEDDAVREDAQLIAAPVVAAELRRLARVIGPQRGIVDGSDDMTRRACADALNRRADELDPPQAGDQS